MFQEWGTKLDNKIQDIKEWWYRGKVYALYVRLRIPSYIRKIQHIDVLNRFLSHCENNGWVSEKDANRYRENWISMIKENEIKALSVKGGKIYEGNSIQSKEKRQ